MDTLFQYQTNLLNAITNDFRRYLQGTIPWNSRFVAIKGLSGVGKTTMLLQHLKFDLKDASKHLYATLDHPYFYDESLYDLANQFYQQGGMTLLLDEVHKYPKWSREIKMIYDGLPNMQVIFSASSALDILRGEADLSRRVLIYELHGLSFREYLHFVHGYLFEAWTIDTMVKDHMNLSQAVLDKVQPLPLFQSYLESGYFPFSKGEEKAAFQKRINQVLETTLAEDMNYINDYSLEDIYKLKKLLAVISNISPFTINVSEVADKLKLGRNTVKTFLHALKDAGVLNFLNREGRSTSVLQKPDKLYIENTNFSYALSSNPDVGTLRETFAVNQLKNAGYDITLPKKGDVMVNHNNQEYILEIVGKNKTKKQIKELDNAFILSDDITIGFGNKIPLWMLGFLY